MLESRPLITSDSKTNTLLSELVRYVLLKGSLNLCSCTPWILDLDGLVEINTAWLYKQPKAYKQMPRYSRKDSVGLGIRGYILGA